ncbi:MAG: hypothetical protein JWO94_3083 [Verrucomicrobiaceae bacterium]|nr:hypothetical protein [Verrucomicrobiaceae bacterium]
MPSEFRPSICLALASALLLSSVQTASAGWKAGAARIKITPDYPVRLSGYGNRTTEFEGVKADLWAKALAIAWDDEPPAVVITVDNCGVPGTLRDEVLAGLANQHLVTERFALCSTHTHCAPMLKGMLANMFGMDLPPDQQEHVDRYTAEVRDKLIKVAVEAVTVMKPASLSAGHGKVGFASNRRLPTPAGFTNSQNVDGLTDHDLPVLKVTDENGTVRAIFTSYACHCTTMGWNFVYPDWAGMAQADLEKAYPEAIALTAIGCGADQNPYPRHEEANALQHGQALADEAARVVKGSTRPLKGPLQCEVRSLRLPYEAVPPKEHWEELAANGKSLHEKHLGSLFLAMLARKEAIPTELPYLVQAWRFSDDLAMVFLNGEVVVDYGLRLKREYDKERLWVNGYSNNVPCYIPSERVLAEGGYEAGGAMLYYARPNKFAPGLEDKIIGAVHELVPDVFKPRP